MAKSCYLPQHPGTVDAVIGLPSSKSETNRALIIQALSGGKITLDNLAEARDSQTMLRLLASQELVLDVIDAGTTMRFLTAFSTVMQRETILTGTPRMCQRPIKLLVDALKSLGGEIDYLREEGFPPIHVKSFQQTAHEITIDGSVSSQYISALLMVAPTLERGLTLHLTGEIGSRPYINMTLQLMSHFGVKGAWKDNSIIIPSQPYQPNHYHIESDWSGAGYWFSLTGLAKQGRIKLLGLRKDSLQADRVVVEIMENMGVSTTFMSDGILIEPNGRREPLEYDFTDCPDLAQTIAVYCAAQGIPARLNGLRSLRIKETDRIAALQNELAKLGCHLTVHGDDTIVVPAGEISPTELEIHTYDDHRMAMAFAPLAMRMPVTIAEPFVVRKSYPSFWAHLEKAGLNLVLTEEEDAGMD